MNHKEHGNNKPDRLEEFFRRSLEDYQEDPGDAIWKQIANNIPAKPTAISYLLKDKFWAMLGSFIIGVLLSGLFFYGYSKMQLLHSLETEVLYKNEVITQLKKEITELKNNNTEKSIPQTETATAFNENNALVAKTPPVRFQKDYVQNTKSYPEKNELVIKPEIARTENVAAPTSFFKRGMLQPFITNFNFSSKNLFSPIKSLPFEKSLWANTLTNQNITKNKSRSSLPQQPILKKLAWNKVLKAEQKNKYRLLDADDKDILTQLSKSKKIEQLEEGRLSAFVMAGFNPFSGLKYSIEGYRPNIPLRELAGVSSSWTWSITGGFETRSNWTVQFGLDYNKLNLIKESVNNIRFKVDEANVTPNGYLYSLNQQFDGPIGRVIVNTSINNQLKNDGRDIRNGSLFQLSVKTIQPLKIIRLPIVGGYKININSRLYLTTKIGVAAVWRTKEQVTLESIRTFNDRLSVQYSDIYLTNKTTTESLEALLRTELGFRWRSRWYIIAEPRFKYSHKSLFTHGNLNLKDAPMQLVLGLRFNID